MSEIIFNFRSKPHSIRLYQDIERERLVQLIMREVPIWEQYALTVEEAAAYFRIGEGRLREFIKGNINSDCLLWAGNRALIKRKKFEQYLDKINVI